jgi:hypothetical protein
MADFTPGPWRIVGGFTVNTYRVEAKDGSICTPCYGRPERGTDLANARLIAAAPDLLAALKEVSKWLAAQRDFEFGNATPEEYAAVESARDAIAKAEGTTHG